MYMNQCPYCGCSLDPCERCDCQENKQENQAETLDIDNEEVCYG